jgi:hypothetical protein
MEKQILGPHAAASFQVGDIVTERGQPDLVVTKVAGRPRPRTDYRAVRRNAAKAARKLPEWRESVSDAANERAGLAARQNQANGAREAAAKALVDATHTSGTPRHVLAASAMLAFYRTEKQTRAVSRIVRELERQVRA